MLKEDDLVLCTVKRIEGTNVFLDIEGNGEGSLVMSEIAAGRIRNLREYVAPNKKVVCKVLKIINGHPQLSLRRVTGKEREDVMDKYQKEKTFRALLKSLIKDPESAISEIKKNYELWDFSDKIKENPELVKKVFSKEDAAALEKALAEKRDTEKIAKETILVLSESESGISDIKHILDVPNVEVKYLGSSKFSVIGKGIEFKEAKTKITKAIELIEKRAKDKKANFERLEAK